MVKPVHEKPLPIKEKIFGREAETENIELGHKIIAKRINIPQTRWEIHRSQLVIMPKIIAIQSFKES